MVFRAGQRLASVAVRFPPLPDTGLYGFESLQQFEGAVLLLVAMADGDSHTFGSAVLVEKGIALAAGHVIQHHADQGHFEGDWVMYAFGPATNGMHCWAVAGITFSAVGYIAVLTLHYAADMGEELKLHYFEMSARLPRVGEIVTALGFRSLEPIIGADPDVGLEPAEGLFLGSSGPVLDVWPGGRDRLIAPRPCFAADLRTVGAMSGGPVLDSRGKVVGIVTSSNDDGDGDAYTLSTMIWDGLGIKVVALWPPHAFWPQEPTALISLADVEDGWRLHWSDDGAQYRYQGGGDGPDATLYAPFDPAPDPLTAFSRNSQS